jgi:DNA-binding IclR family transcriptional regulator
MTMTAEDREDRRLGVLERVTLIMDAFADAPGRLVLEDITRITGLPRSTVFRMLRQLVELGWVERLGREYAPGHRITRHSTDTDSEAIRVAASQALSELHAATCAVVHLSVLAGQVVHYLDKVGGTVTATVPSRVGARILAPDSVSGRAILSWLDPEVVDALFPDLPAERSLDLHRELATIRRRGGVAWSDGMNRRSRISSLAVAVLGQDGPIAAISVARRGALRPGQVSPLVVAAARATRRELESGGRPGGHLRLA